jgi:hypothetical protein
MYLLFTLKAGEPMSTTVRTLIATVQRVNGVGAVLLKSLGPALRRFAMPAEGR